MSIGSAKSLIGFPLHQRQLKLLLSKWQILTNKITSPCLARECARGPRIALRCASGATHLGTDGAGLLCCSRQAVNQVWVAKIFGRGSLVSLSSYQHCVWSIIAAVGLNQ